MPYNSLSKRPQQPALQRAQELTPVIHVIHVGQAPIAARPVLFLFVHVDGVRADNDMAERCLQPVLIGRKISGGIGNPAGSKTCMAPFSLFATWQLRDLKAYQPQHAHKHCLNAGPDPHPVGPVSHLVR